MLDEQKHALIIGVIDMEETTQKQLLGYIDAAMTFYEQVTGKLPTDKQIQVLLAIAGVHIALESIRTNAKILRELSSEESEQVLRRIVDELFSIAEPGLLKSALWTRYQRLNSKQ